MTILTIATRNEHKTSEIRGVLGGGYRYVTLKELPEAPNVVEDADTFAGNAAKKAIELARWISSSATFNRHLIPHFVLADDSGLEVDALAGKPGVHSARFAGLDSGRVGNSSDADNNAKLLRLLNGVPLGKRTARFRCVIALVRIEMSEEAGKDLRLFDGVCEGRIGFEAGGAGGFGYDPLFTPDGFEQTFAVLGEHVKNQISHRAKALEKLKAQIAGLV